MKSNAFWLKNKKSTITPTENKSNFYRTISKIIDAFKTVVRQAKLMYAKRLFFGLLMLLITALTQPLLANDQKVQRLIQESIASYPGKCACPYSIMSNGRKCGGRSAYSKPGGYSPLCYPKDVYRKYPSLKSTGTGASLYNY